MLQTKKIILVIAFIATLAIGVVIGLNVRKHTPTITESETTPTPSDYRELLSSEIRGIDPDTIEGYLTGAGLGFALHTQLAKTGQLKTQLRSVHLRTHLATVAILPQHQVMQYNALRGYEDMPAGHHNEHE